MGSTRRDPKKAGQRTLSVADALFSKTQQRMLALLFGQPERGFAKQELIQLTRSGSGAVQRELERLVQTGLVSVSIAGFQKLYRANPSASIYEELRRIVDKTLGIADQVQRALTPLKERIKLAVLYGATAKGADTAVSDVDVLVVSDDVTLEELFDALKAVEENSKRHVSPTLYTTEEFRQRRRKQNAFVMNVLKGRHVVLVGAENAI